MDSQLTWNDREYRIVVVSCRRGFPKRNQSGLVMEIIENPLRIQVNPKGAVYLVAEALIDTIHKFRAISIGFLSSTLKQVLPTFPFRWNDKGVNKTQQMVIETGQLIHGYLELVTMFMRNAFPEVG
jgi:hypothetical protein